MKNFEKLLNIADVLLSPQGCAWDREQTLYTLQPYLLEEVHELIEAIDLQEGPKMAEEWGDVLYALVFIARLGERKNLFKLEEAIEGVSEKLIRRHPHVFGDKKVQSTEEIVQNWEEIKKKEGRKSPIEGIPPSLPALARAQKVIHKLRRIKSPLITEDQLTVHSEKELGKRLWELVQAGDSKGYDAESALRRACLKVEENSRR